MRSQQIPVNDDYGNHQSHHQSHSPRLTDLLRLEIAMDYPVSVNKLHGLEHSPGQIACVLLGVHGPLAQSLKDIPAAGQLQDEMEGLRLLEEVDQVDDAIVATTQRLEDGHLPVHGSIVLRL